MISVSLRDLSVLDVFCVEKRAKARRKGHAREKAVCTLRPRNRTRSQEVEKYVDALVSMGEMHTTTTQKADDIEV